MELKESARVVNATGDGVGHIDRVVLNPKTKEITAIIVRKGLLFTQDKVVPISMVDASNENGVVLNGSAGDLKNLQDYESTYYVPADEEDYRGHTRAGDVVESSQQNVNAEPVYAYPPFGVSWGGTFAPGGMMTGAPTFGKPELIRKTQINIADDEVALKKGAKVLASNGDHIGNIDEVLSDPGSRRASHFVLSHGVLFKTRKLIPMDWVRNVTDEQVKLVVGPRALEQLRDYNAEGKSEVPIL